MSTKNVNLKDASLNVLYPKTRASLVFTLNGNLGTVLPGAQLNKLLSIKVNDIEVPITDKCASINLLFVQQQADWLQSNSQLPSFIKNKPETIPASIITISDSGNYFISDTLLGVLQLIGNKLYDITAILNMIKW